MLVAISFQQLRVNAADKAAKARAKADAKTAKAKTEAEEAKSKSKAAKEHAADTKAAQDMNYNIK
jgi:hypothetical protein